MRYEVKAKCGHVGRNHYVIVPFCVIAENGKEAAEKVRRMPRVKHHDKKAIVSVTELSESEYIFLNEMLLVNPFIHCANIQQQKKECQEMVILDEENEMKTNERHIRKKQLFFRREKNLKRDFESNIKDYWASFEAC